MKKIVCLLVTLLLLPCCLWTGCSDNGGPSEGDGEHEQTMTEEEYRRSGAYAYYYYEQLGRDVMPIGAWCAPPASNFGGMGNPNYITDENYKIMSESGINSIYALYDQPPDHLTEVLDALDFADKYGMVYLVRDLRMMAVSEEPELLDELFDDYISKPAYGGNLIVDEPGVNSFEMLGRLKKAWDNKFDGTENMYVNMLPMYASQNQLINGAAGGTDEEEITYEEYVEQYLQTVDPDLFSFDYYPFNGQNTNVEQEYFEQLSIVKSRVEKAGIPFWTFAQAGFFDSEDSRKMEESEFQWQVNTALSYGAKGIQYFNYWHPLEIPGNNCGFVDKEGNKTYLYDYGVRMNKQIAAVDEVLMKSANRGVMQVGESPAPVPTEDILQSFGPLTEAEGGDALIGCFDTRGKTSFYITANSLTEDAEITLHFSGEVSLAITQDAVRTQQSGTALRLSIPKGEGVLVEIL